MNFGLLLFLIMAYLSIGWIVVAVLDAMDESASDLAFLPCIFWPVLIIGLVFFGYMWVLWIAGHWIGEWIKKVIKYWKVN